MRVAWQQLLGALLSLALLALLLPGPARCVDVLLGRTSASPPGTGPSSTIETAMLLLASVIVWSLLLWGSIVALVALTGRLPGGMGRGARVMLARVAPGAARRLLLTAVGASMVTGLAAGGTGTADAASVQKNVPHQAGRPSIARTSDHLVPRTGVPVQAASWTSVEGSAVQLGSDLMDPAGGSEAGPGGQMNIDWPALPVHTGTRTPTAPVDIDWPAAATPVVVLRGDTLWSIAARHLPPGAEPAQIELATHAWYAANTAAIGDDPDLILPGQILQPPNQEAGHHS